MLFLDGLVRVLVDFTDYGSLALSSDPSSSSSSSSCTSLSLVSSILAAIPLELVRDRYLPQLADWVTAFPLGSGDTGARVGIVEHRHDDAATTTAPWLLLFTRRVEAFLGRRRAGSGGNGGNGGNGGGGLLGKGIAEGRNICLLGLVLSEGFAARENRDQVKI